MLTQGASNKPFPDPHLVCTCRRLQFLGANQSQTLVCYPNVWLERVHAPFPDHPWVDVLCERGDFFLARSSRLHNTTDVQRAETGHNLPVSVRIKFQYHHLVISPECILDYKKKKYFLYQIYIPKLKAVANIQITRNCISE